MTRPFASGQVRPKSKPNSCLLPSLCLQPEESQPQFSQFMALGSPRLAATLMGPREENNPQGGCLEALAARTPVGRHDPGLQGETTLLEITSMPVKLKLIYQAIILEQVTLIYQSGKLQLLLKMTFIPV